MPSKKLSRLGLLFHGQTSFDTCSFILAPVNAETGMNVTSLGLKMPFLRNDVSCDLINSNRSCSQLTVGSSILLTTMMRRVTPAVLTSWACSRVWPPLSKPASNSPFRAEMTCRGTK